MGRFRIKDFRKAQGMFQGDFAKLIGLTQSNLSRYETNNIDLTIEQMNILREKFGKEAVDEYMDGEDYQYDELSQMQEPSMNGIDVNGFINIIKSQNDTICRQVDIQNEFTKQLTAMNSRLLDLLEKIEFN